MNHRPSHALPRRFSPPLYGVPTSNYLPGRGNRAALNCVRRAGPPGCGVWRELWPWTVSGSGRLPQLDWSVCVWYLYLLWCRLSVVCIGVFGVVVGPTEYANTRLVGGMRKGDRWIKKKREVQPGTDDGRKHFGMVWLRGTWVVARGGPVPGRLSPRARGAATAERG